MVFEVISIIMLVLTVGLFIWHITRIIIKSRYIKNTGNTIRLKNKTFNANYIWILLVPLNLLNIHSQIEKSSAQGNPSRERCYVYLGICYIILLILFVIIYVSGRYSYISENCFISIDFNKISLDNSELTYRTDGDILELYYKKKTVPFKYRIVGNKYELAEMLDRNYQQH
ncbi:MAG: hypothetical protein K2J40_07405 [Ruminococcus sp.]|nr:hypothetical protein [Ruminococcus sp.]